MDKVLDVKNLRISFKTGQGTVKAVRDISFSLNKGETLAIVGESGSGKSVTSRAIMGILAGNSIVESGEIIYDGQDLLKIPEEDFHFLRGEKLSMIFQDPLSSLNPIVKIGRQLTEAMLIKGKTRQKKMRKLFNAKLELLLNYTNKATNAENDKEVKNANAVRIKTFDGLAIKHITLEQAYNIAFDTAVELIDEIKDFVFELEKKATRSTKKTAQLLVESAEKTIHEYVVHEDAEKLNTNIEKIKAQIQKLKAEKSREYSVFIEPLNIIKDILSRAITFVKPDFFAMAYCILFEQEELPKLLVPELNKFMSEKLNSQYMIEFNEFAQKALKYSFDETIEKKKKTLGLLKEANKFFSQYVLEKQETIALTKKLILEVEQAINKLDVKKDSLEYTFKSSINDAVHKYFNTQKSNTAETERFNREKAKYNKQIENGKKLDWEVVPANIIDLEIIQNDICQLVAKLIDNYELRISNANEFDVVQETQNLLLFFKNTASAVVQHITKGMAKHRALKIMEEVGIPQPRKRFNQYPFEFSGGMRQRIVIAIALSVLPDILICDEPTTALDVTIQSQILELINELKAKHNLSIIFITHDLGVVANMADRIAVMYAGKIVEYGTAEDIFYSPAHPYTWALLSSMPDMDTNEKLEAIPGVPPNMIYPPKGDAFAARNKYAMKIDFEQEPPMFKISDTHYAATWLLHPDAPKVEMPKIVTERIARNKTLFDNSVGTNDQLNKANLSVEMQRTTEESMQSKKQTASKTKTSKTTDTKNSTLKTPKKEVTPNE